MFHKTTDSGFTLELKNHHKFNIVCFNLSCYTSVRGMQYVLDMTVNAKKPDNLAHKLPYKCYRIQPLVLWPYPEDFEKLAYSEKFL